MNASVDILFPSPSVVESESLADSVDASRRSKWNSQEFAQEQLESLIRQVFVPGFPRPSRQVVLSAVERGAGAAHVCKQVGELLAARSGESVCIVETDLRTRFLEKEFGGTSIGGEATPELAGAVQLSSLQIADKLWFMPAHAFAGTPQNASSVAWLRTRLGAIRREFGYALFHAPPIAREGSASLLAHLADGLILVLQAHRTRRATVKLLREILQGSNVRLLGAVLSERRFPIPESLYQRL